MAVVVVSLLVVPVVARFSLFSLFLLTAVFSLSSVILLVLSKLLYVLDTGKCIRRFAGIYAYCRYFIDRKW